MLEFAKPVAQVGAATMEVLGVGIITVIAAWALVRGAVDLGRGEQTARTFHLVRQHLGRGILLGLEFLVAADIIHTVAVEFTFEAVGVLAIIVVIRTLLSFVLEVELTGHWPWQQHQTRGPGSPPG